MSEKLNNADFADLEIALKALRPATQLDRDALIYRAGQAATPRRNWTWPAFTAAMTVVAATLAFVLVSRPEPAALERVIYVTVPQKSEAVIASVAGEKIVELSPIDPPPLAPPAFEQPSGPTLWQMREFALRWGIDKMPMSSSPFAPASVKLDEPPQTLQSLMNAWENRKPGKHW